MTVELISVGTEILMGNIVNSNTQFLAEKCAMLGFDLFFQVTVGDNYDRMMSCLLYTSTSSITREKVW